ncbi:unnamed protein product [Callosobruchus maculatus]|uniref:Reverse transcriptase domain-containing protein n=2 Tax=Callosobruchus maculatus TaxID=64391 RepID=A0A653BKQ4_CALMS|nr:unnamed protein product [Callosobruchus maculatus]
MASIHTGPHNNILIKNNHTPGCRMASSFQKRRLLCLLSRTNTQYPIPGMLATRKGVRQGCVLSPVLFNIYSEFVMRQVLDNWNGDITIGGSKISNLRFADDTTLIAASQEQLVALLNILEQHSAAYGLGINYNKTKVMIVDREHDNHREIKSIGRCEVVQSFVYLGSLIDNSGSCENEIRRRIQQARVVMTKLTKIWRDHNITKATKISLVLVFSIFLHASETWTVKKADRARIDAFEMWTWRRREFRIPPIELMFPYWMSSVIQRDYPPLCRRECLHSSDIVTETIVRRNL